MGVIVSLPISEQPFVVFNALTLPSDMVQWLNTQVGLRGEDWGADFSWNTMCWNVAFRKAEHAVLFKLTWVGAIS